MSFAAAVAEIRKNCETPLSGQSIEILRLAGRGVISSVGVADGAPVGVTAREASEAISMGVAGCTQRLRRLKERGLVRRSNSVRGGPESSVWLLTPAGLEALA